jgi:hypothetical protein
MAVAKFALPQRPALYVGESGEHGAASLAPAHAAAPGVFAGEQLNLCGQAASRLRLGGQRLGLHPLVAVDARVSQDFSPAALC